MIDMCIYMIVLVLVIFKTIAIIIEIFVGHWSLSQLVVLMGNCNVQNHLTHIPQFGGKTLWHKKYGKHTSNWPNEIKFLLMCPATRGPLQ